jgi:toxic protein SymE
MARRQCTQAKPVCHTRRIKMGRIIYDYRRKDHSQACVPWLQLKGHWLERAGFEIGAPISVRVMEGCLVLIAETGEQAETGR